MFLGVMAQEPSCDRGSTAPTSRRDTARVVRTALEDEDPRVREAAAEELRGLAGPQIAWTFVTYLWSGSETVRGRALNALGVIGNLATLPVLVRRVRIVWGGGPRSHVLVGTQFAYVRDFDVEVAQGAAAFDPVIGVATDGTVLDVRPIKVEEEITLVVPLAAAGALRRMTGQDFGTDYTAWKRWLDENWPAIQASLRKEREEKNRAEKAERCLETARTFEARGESDLAWGWYERVVREGPEVWAELARGRIEAMELKEDFRETLEEARRIRRAKGRLQIAQNFALNGQTARAREVLLELCENPDTPDWIRSLAKQTSSELAPCPTPGALSTTTEP